MVFKNIKVVYVIQGPRINIFTRYVLTRHIFLNVCYRIYFYILLDFVIIIFYTMYFHSILLYVFQTALKDV